MIGKKIVLGSAVLLSLLTISGVNAKPAQAQAITSKFSTGLIKKTTTEYAGLDSTAKVATLKKNQVIKINSLKKNAKGLYRFQLSTGKYVTADTASIQKLIATYKNYYYLKPSTSIIKVLHKVGYYRSTSATKATKYLTKGDFAHVLGVYYTKAGRPMLKISNGEYITSNRSWVANSNGYQNPKRYFQVQNSKIRPAGTIGYTLKRGYEGVKTWKIKRQLGIGGRSWYEYATYDRTTVSAVKNFQRRHHLSATGNVNLATWEKLGFSKSSWTSIDSYTAPLYARTWQGRSAHVNAEIKQAYRYLGRAYIVGASSTPTYGTDCSGLVMQALYAGGLNMNSVVSSIHHAYPGNEWNSRNLWTTSKLRRVSYAGRKKGDLIFYYEPGTRSIYHVAIYLGNNRIIESWPNHIQVSGIRSNSHTSIAGVKRAFN
ncbi:DUF5776 domain-containing protein [Pediococcus damnosus]|uniref:DUF5776 domain-containing protein n=1 Tax=Pediococcus damnosus TaxID=51663 RepID=UPI001EE0A141|nr:DUF5776 domain-containing protein [Pediococcus damnosus]